MISNLQLLLHCNLRPASITEKSIRLGSIRLDQTRLFTLIYLTETKSIICISTGGTSI